MEITLVKRIPLLLVALLALVVAACSSEQTSSSTPPSQAEATATPEASSEAPEPSSAAAEPSDAPGGDGTALADILPDSLNGAPRTELPGMEAILGPALGAQGLDPEDVEFIFATYGEGTDSVAVNGFRIAGMSQVSLEQFGRLMAGVDAQGAQAETVTVGGKSVLKFSGTEGQAGSAYLYFADGAMFTVVSESEDLAGQLLAELP
jgi:hypothetical protein